MKQKIEVEHPKEKKYKIKNNTSAIEITEPLHTTVFHKCSNVGCFTTRSSAAIKYQLELRGVHLKKEKKCVKSLPKQI